MTGETRIRAGRQAMPSLTVTALDRVLAAGAVVLLAVALAAIARGHADWARVPGLIWLHLATILIALSLTPIMLLRRRGDAPHRLLGKIWVAAMTLTAALSLGIRTINPGQFSLIHLLSLWVLFAAPMVWWSAATHRLATHVRFVRGMVIGALLIAGFFTFPFHRLLGHWLFA